MVITTLTPISAANVAGLVLAQLSENAGAYRQFPPLLIVRVFPNNL
jgi:hypothetical protein